MEINNYLLFANIICWFVPVLYAKGLVRKYLFVVSFIFSGSYWSSIVFNMLYEIEMPPTVVSWYINTNLYYSAVAAILFYSGLYLFLKSDVGFYMNYHFAQIKDGFGFKSRAYSVLIIVGILLTVIIYVSAIPYIGVSGRTYFMGVLRPFWYSVLVPLNMFILVAINLLNKNIVTVNSIKKDILFWLLLFAHVVIVGFDGSRRESLLPLFFVIIKVVLYNYKYYDRFLVINMKTINIGFLFVLVAFLSRTRSYDVGWGVFTQSTLSPGNIFRSIMDLLLSLNPTIHVNTAMLQLVDIEGVHGFWSYLQALGNFMLPRFLFHDYYFGEPLVLELHERFHWYGLDFGFMAEAIYAGGLAGVMISHFLYGLFIAYTLNGFASKKRGVFFAILSITILFGMVNSLRSDFMNLMKATLYPAFALYAVYWISTRISTKSSLKNLVEI